MKLKPQFRAIEINGLNEETKTLTLSFSSEAPYERYWGIEILDHSPGAMDMSRLQNGAPLLFNHDLDTVVGVVERAWIDGGKGYAEVRFGESEKAEEVYKDVQVGVLRNVSVGYQIQEMVKEGERDGVETYRVTKWQPFEISIVSVPADATVGVGRSFDAEQPVQVKSKEDVQMEKETKKPETKAPEVDVHAIETQAREAERKRVAEISAIGEKFGESELTRQFIESGKPADEFRAAILEKLSRDAKPAIDTKGADVEIGMSDNEVRQFSIVRAINAMANPANRKAQEAAKFEFEVSEEAQRKAGVEARGILVPFDVLNRSLTATGADTGSNTVATDLLAGDFISLLRNRSAVLGRATIMQGLSGNVAIPRQTAGIAPQDLAETDPTTAADLGLDQVTLTPRRVGGQSSYSKQLLQQSSLDVENLIRNDLVQQIALRIDYNALNGTGTNAPVGLLNAAGVNLVEIGTDGGAPTWQHIVAMESAIAAANADVDDMAYLVNAKTNGYLKTTPKEAGQPIYLVDDGMMNGYEVGVTNQLPSNLTKGTGTGLSALAFGNWRDMLIGFWGGIDIVVDPYTQKGSGLIEVQADQFYDVALRHPESFSVIKDAAV